MTPYTLGGNNAGTSSGTTLQFTLTHAVAAGDALVVAAASNSAGDTVTSITDSQNNTWVSAGTDYNQADGLAVFYVLNAVAMTTSDTITATFTGSSGSHTIVGRGCNGIGTGAALDVVITNDNVGSTSPSSGSSGTLRQSSEWAVAFLCNANGGGSPTAWTGGFTAQSTQHATSNEYLTVADQTVSATTALTAGATITSATWAMILVSFRAAPYLAGAATFASGSTSTAVTIGAATGSQAVASGDAVLVICGIGSTASAPSSVTDSASQTYTLIASNTGNSMCSYVYAKYNSAALAVSTGSVTVTWSATTGNKIVQVVGANGLATSAALDQSATNFGSGLAPSSGATPALAQAGEPCLGVIVGGSASVSAATTVPWVQLGSTLHPTGGVFMAVGQQAAADTSGVTATGTLGSSANWSALAATFQLASGGTTFAGTNALSITTTSPLPAGQVGVPYSDQLVAAGGAPPYTWAVTSGTLTTGLKLESGTTSSTDFGYIGVNTGPQGGPTLGQWNTATYGNSAGTGTFGSGLLGKPGCYKFFFSTALPSSWAGTLMDQITKEQPGVFCYIAWFTQMSATAISQFIQTIPSYIKAVGFTYDSEPEGGGWTDGKTFVGAYLDQAAKIRAAQPLTSTQLIMLTSARMDYYRAGGDASYIPPASTSSQAGVDVFTADMYDRSAYATGSDMSSDPAWQRWLGFVKGRGKPIGLTEYGISGFTTDAAQNTRLHADLAYLQGAFGPGGSVSTQPLFCWLYWDTGGAGNYYPTGTINQFRGPVTEATWKSIETLAGTGTGGGGGTGGLIHGTPTTTTGSPFGFTVTVTDSANATANKAFTMSVTAANALAIGNSNPLDGATVGALYTEGLLASGGTPPYTWSLQAGTLPAGLAISGQTITGTPTTPGTSAITLKVTDSVAATATLATSLTVAAGVTISTTSPLTGGTVGTSYSTVLAATGGTSPYTWSVTAGALPAGLALDPDGTLNGTAGQIFGTPTTVGVSTFTVSVADSAGGTAADASAVFTLAVTSGTGIIPPGRGEFGGGDSDFAITASGTSISLAPGATVTFWNALVGGSQYTDLQNAGGGAITSVTADANGQIPKFFGPPGPPYVWRMAADAGGGTRRWVIRQDFGDWLNLVYASLVKLGG